MPSREHRIGLLMCEATQNQLLPTLADWQRQPVDAQLEFRVGRGRATHHRFDRETRRHRITYGVKMVAEKAAPAHCGGWLSSREIRQRGYFAGELSELNLLTHTCCHEFAHFVQSLMGWRLVGEVHNADFYRVLDHLHDQGHAGRVKTALREQARLAGLTLDSTPVQVETARDLLARFLPGQEVTFGDGHQGRIVRINRKTCTVEGTAHCRGLRYRVSPQLLRVVENV
ncbi:hypothetical protein QQM79_08330 [Marinobacteraceae bacterium S3BR75-40.1]